MKLKLIPLLLLPALMLLVACGGATEPTPDIDAMVEARVKEVIAALSAPTPLPTPTPEIVIKEVPVEVVKEIIVEKEVIKEVFTNDLAKVQSLQQDIVVLKEQVAQAIAVNKELEENISALKAEVASTPTAVPTPTPTATPSPTATRVPSWIPMVVEVESVIVEESRTAYVLFVITNPNDETGSISAKATAVDENGYGMSGHNYLVNGGAVVLPHETVAVIDNRQYPIGGSPSEYILDSQSNNFEGRLLMSGYGYPHWYSGGGVNWSNGIDVDPVENAFFSIGDSWIYNVSGKTLWLGWVCQDEVSLEKVYASIDENYWGGIPDAEGHPPTFSRFSEITHIQIAIGGVQKMESKTKIGHPKKYHDDLGEIIYSKDDLITKCHTWKVYP